MLAIPGHTLAPQSRIGPGLVPIADSLLVTRIGRIDASESVIHTCQKRYVPSCEPVIGTIISKHAEFYKLNIGSAHDATLSNIAFEGANRRNRPALEVGGLVYCRITMSDRDREPDAVCVDMAGKSDGFGELVGGMVVKVSMEFARR